RLAEEIKFGELTSGAGNDFEKATELAQKMVREWGMSEKMGPLVYGKKDGQIFLGKDLAQAADYSEITAQQIDAEVRRIVTTQYDRAKNLIAGHVDMLDRIAHALLEYETIDGAELLALMRGESLSRTKPAQRVKSREELLEEKAELLAGAAGDNNNNVFVVDAEPEMKKV
ncbi:MAG TPA: ATP-dependent zinc metalloprotease FtsH, partial [Myxococcota bacterium]|nr:ATP-dependent zinc metalloprotease FtsH [Myxococcota bacterium]